MQHVTVTEKQSGLLYSFSVPFNGDAELIYLLDKYPVDDLYGKLQRDIFGGAFTN